MPKLPTEIRITVFKDGSIETLFDEQKTSKLGEVYETIIYYHEDTVQEKVSCAYDMAAMDACYH